MGRPKTANRKNPMRWDGRRLWWGSKPIKTFDRRAPGQTAVLAEFQRLATAAGGWPERIDVRHLLPAGRAGGRRSNMHGIRRGT